MNITLSLFRFGPTRIPIRIGSDCDLGIPTNDVTRNQTLFSTWVLNNLVLCQKLLLFILLQFTPLI